ncbi:MAG: Lon protease [Candidatus Yanofskybacteria bacterium GW2011_GWA1_48_10]|uniref:Lon protease n=3 Tax=Parcubacteria group TaxID=1794811 RepID=A0A0G1U7E7_9BACT|nr:MAG: Lon protease [Candidatus Yanofskybacteria bacterium GW2011_GWA1_48_10]OGN05976.1 MAG: endopeptidase La [Candidatus Yanofskybacteria bacterium RIFCSPHIGHO2_01_FULL_48_25b]
MSEFKINNIIIPEELPVIPLKNTLLLPKLFIPIIIQRSRSIGALDFAQLHNRLVLFVTQRNSEDEISRKDLYEVGTIGRIVSVFKLPDGSSKLDIEGLVRARITEFIDEEPFFKVKAEPFSLIIRDSLDEKALLRRVLEQFRAISEARSAPTILPEIVYMLSQLKDIEHLMSLMIVNLNIDVDNQQRLLELESVLDVLRQLNMYLSREVQILETEKTVARETKKQIGKMQKELFLREQLKSIEKELGVDDEKDEFDSLKQKIAAAGMPKEVEDKALKELSRLIKMPAFNPEGSYIRSYLDLLVELPWSKKTKEKINLKEAEKILNEDHHGLPKVKERILEYLAVQKQAGKLKGPILCLAGPPGTGKTSVGQSIARALGREFVRVSLGGLRDEAEIRGHRRTYVGAMPGRLIQGIQNVKVKNPVFMLDEIDKVGIDFRGDPSSALLEALDPRQNHAFSDHYLEVPFDLSDVMFIGTANRLDTIPPALLDRMEIIEFPGYTELEKFHIAKNFLLPKLYKDHGLKKRSITIQDSAIMQIIRNHTREAGVRELERQLAAVIRKVVRKIVESSTTRTIVVGKEAIQSYLGPVRYTHELAEQKDEIGRATALAWTPVGGDLMPIEVVRMPGTGKQILTGQLGIVMKESAQASLSWARAYAARNGVKEELYKEDIHIHAPSGGIKKDGPSAGTAITTALVSLFLKRPVKKEVAMTGEITLRGKVLGIGGLKEKVLAAHRAGIKVVIIPHDNKKDLVDIPREIQRDIKIIFVKNMEDVLKVALRA